MQKNPIAYCLPLRAVPRIFSGRLPQSKLSSVGAPPRLKMFFFTSFLREQCKKRDEERDREIFYNYLNKDREKKRFSTLKGCMTK